MNPAALKANMKWLKDGATIIIDIDNFDNKHYKKAGYIEDPLHDESLDGYNVVKAPISELSRNVAIQHGLDNKGADKTRNQFVAGLLYWLFNRDITIGEDFLKANAIHDLVCLIRYIEIIPGNANLAAFKLALTKFK